MFDLGLGAWAYAEMMEAAARATLTNEAFMDHILTLVDPTKN